MKYDVFGIGQALMDMIVKVENDNLSEFGLEKGKFHRLDDEEASKLNDIVKKCDVRVVPGGSAANVLYGVALLGGNTVFCGAVGDDDHGKIYEQNLEISNVRTNLGKKEGFPTGCCMTFVTPDSERTFAVNLGASVKISDEDIFYDDLKDSKILHLEGYQVHDDSQMELCIKAMKFAKENEVVVSLDLGDPNLVSENKEMFKQMINEHVDIVFANGEEAMALFDMDVERSLNELSKICNVAVVTIGKEGSLVMSKGDIYQVDAFEADVVDTTGAGDMYAAGFLYGYSRGEYLERCGVIGAYLASKVIQQLGARIEKIGKEEIENL